MATTEETKIPLQILVDRAKKKVIFAEADNDFVDILFSFLTLPMGTIARNLAKHSDSQPKALGSLSTLYESIANLQHKYFWTDECKDMLLNPRNSSEAQCSKLKLNIDDTDPTKYFICKYLSCHRRSGANLSTYNTARCECGKLMTLEIGQPNSNVSAGHGKAGVFAIETTTFIISDDLRVMPNLSSSSIELLNDIGIGDMRALEENTLNIGFKEILNLLELSLFSKTPLTDMFFCQKTIISHMVKSEPANETTDTSKKMSVKVMVRNSNNKAVFAEAEEDFIDFIFGFLTIPLGSVVSLLSGNTSLGCMDNLYRSISSLNIGKYMKSQEIKDMLLDPPLPPQYHSKNQIFSLNETTTPFYCHSYYNYDKYVCYLSVPRESNSCTDHVCSELTFTNPKGEGGFVRGPSMFMVTDDLVVTPFSSISGISILNRLNIPLSDIEERIFSIGIEEALSILKASLNTTSALTSGLNLILKKPKYPGFDY